MVSVGSGTNPCYPTTNPDRVNTLGRAAGIRTCLSAYPMSSSSASVVDQLRIVIDL